MYYKIEGFGYIFSELKEKIKDRIPRWTKGRQNDHFAENASNVDETFDFMIYLICYIIYFCKFFVRVQRCILICLIYITIFYF